MADAGPARTSSGGTIRRYNQNIVEVICNNPGAACAATRRRLRSTCRRAALGSSFGSRPSIEQRHGPRQHQGRRQRLSQPELRQDSSSGAGRQYLYRATVEAVLQVLVRPRSFAIRHSSQPAGRLSAQFTLDAALPRRGRDCSLTCPDSHPSRLGQSRRETTAGRRRAGNFCRRLCSSRPSPDSLRR